MSPTSYQAAPPRASPSILVGRWLKSRFYAAWRRRCLASLRTASFGKSRRPRRGIRLRQPVQQLLVSPHEPELLARDPLLQRRIGLHTFLVPRQRIDDVLQRVDRPHQRLSPSALPHQIARTVLAPLHLSLIHI